MTKEEFKLYEELHKKFLNRCREISNRLEEIDNDYSYLDTYYLYDGEVYCEGDNYSSHVEPEHYFKTFQTVFLYDNELLGKYAENLKNRIEKQKQSRKEAEKIAKDLRIQEYERLKQEFEND